MRSRLFRVNICFSPSSDSSLSKIASPSDSSILSQPTSTFTVLSSAFDNAINSIPLRSVGRVDEMVVPVERVDETYDLKDG